MPDMRSFFPTTADAPSTKASLKRALLLTLLLVVVLVAIALLPSPDPGLNPAMPAEATAAVSTSGQQSPSLTTPRASPSLFGPGYILTLVLLAAAGGGALWLKRSSGGVASTGHLREIGRLRVGQTQQIQLVACAGEVLLIGTTPSGVNLLKSFPADSFPALQTAGAALAVPATHFEPPVPSAPEGSIGMPDHDQHTEDDAPEWTVASASAINNGPDFLTVLRRYADRKTYRANTLYPPASTETN